MIEREISNIAKKLFKFYPILAITGPRQSGKTTLVKNMFPKMDYVSLEDIDQRSLAQTDPRGFLSNFPNGAVLDEIQRVPDLFSYLQSLVDQTNSPGQFIILGSQNFLLMKNISQSLAGRVGLLKLLPLSQGEIKKAGFMAKSSEQNMIKGSYPAIYSQNIPSSFFYSNYLATYIERDVRNLKNIGNLDLFARFVQLCAGRVGQPINYASLASDTGVSLNTAKSWISVLQSSYIVFTLPPYYKNFNKRLIKMPKLYFYDTGLLAYLLRIQNEEQLKTHYAIGHIFENYIVSEVIKFKYNRADNTDIYFWKDNKAKEIDLLMDTSKGIIPIEIKAAKTYNASAFSNIAYYQKISETKNTGYVINQAEKNQKSSLGYFISWNSLGELFKEF